MRQMANLEWVIAAPLQILAGIAETNGLDWAAILARHGLTPAHLASPDIKISARSAAAIFDDLAAEIGIESPLLDAFYTVPIGYGSVFDYIGLYASSLRESLRNWHRFYSARSNSFSLSYFEENGSGILEWKIPEHLETRSHIVYSLIPWLAGRIEKILGRDAQEVRVEFAVPCPKGNSQFLQDFPGQITFNRTGNRIVVPGHLLDRVPEAADPSLFKILQEEALQTLEEKDQVASTISQIASAISSRLKTGECSMAAVAAELGTTKQKLQTTLDREGTNFRDLLAAIRRSISERYLTDTDLPIKEIAYLVGFSEISAFSRAATKWFGKSPRAIRREALDAGEPTSSPN